MDCLLEDSMFDPKLKEALGRVQKPGRYTGGEPGSVYKDKEKVDVRFAFCFHVPAPHPFVQMLYYFYFIINHLNMHFKKFYDYFL